MSSEVCFLCKEKDAQGNVPASPVEKKINPFPREAGNTDAQWLIQVLRGVQMVQLDHGICYLLAPMMHRTSCCAVGCLGSVAA